MRCAHYAGWRRRRDTSSDAIVRLDETAMNRRTFLQRLASLPALGGLRSAFPGWATPPETPAPFRRVRPSDSDWPSSAKWETLKQKVGGRLIPVASPLAPCTS